MISISLCMIVRDEEQILGRCLESIKNIPDEIVIVDTGSKDRTIEIAKKYTDKVYQIKWENDFSKARNFSFNQATSQYIMWLDADDFIEEEQYNKLMMLKQSLDEKIDVVLMKYHSEINRKSNNVLEYYRERWIKNNKEMKWVEPVHEIIEMKGCIRYCDIYITHIGNDKRKNRNLEIYNEYLRNGNILTTRGKLHYARELYANHYYKEAKQKFLQFIKEEEKVDQQGCINASLMIAYCNEALEEENIEILYGSFKYAPPRKDICCEIGRQFLRKGLYEKAIFWFKTTLELLDVEDRINPIYKDYKDYLPYIGLSNCYIKMGEFEEANKYNEKAGEVKPYSSEVKTNRQIIEKGRVNETSYLEY